MTSPTSFVVSTIIKPESTHGVVRRQLPPPPIIDDEALQLQICSAFRDFVRIHQALLSTVIGKHGVLAQVSFTQPIAEVLATLEGVIDVSRTLDTSPQSLPP